MSEQDKQEGHMDHQRLIGRKSVLISSIFVILIASFLGYYELTKVAVAIDNNGEQVTVRTHAATVGELLATLNIDVGAHDEVTPALDTKLAANMDVQYAKAEKVILTINDDEKEVYTTAATVGELLKKQSYETRAEDVIEPAAETVIEAGMHVSYRPAVAVTLTYDGEDHERFTAAATVEDFLKETEVAVGDDDRVEPSLDANVEEGLKVQLIRVEKITDVVEESVAFETVEKEDNGLEKGQEKVIEDGKEGREELTYTVTLEDGKEVKRELKETKTLQKSKDRVVAVGTKQQLSNTQTAKSETPVPVKTTATSASSGGKTFMMEATAYTASCNGCSGVTATGINLADNPSMKVIAVDPSVIPLGTRVHVEGYGEAIAGDTGGSIQGNKIDVHVATKEEARRFGRKTVKVTILD
ncbi:G5 and 3D domain-containing protein [Shouchella lonarensis]|uniref:Uncharacterized conserved protein YabE, contains G5 and tandem DUF348 domains n=1 Tax=Shouchella lonarensis TaxID=1464122 RepID=A0A1G6NZE5_9BACI|nr:G5 and 3D domain-containing protein [Shouchella lonarensis]SDC73159.1 Uncharacterized conserved protein YabE, contains G5 and tandem DUF348 domains [Shouchella lonarensis]